MPTYRVTWEIELDAATPYFAALAAQKIQRDPTSTATRFAVAEDFNADGRCHRVYDVDLAEPPFFITHNSEPQFSSTGSSFIDEIECDYTTLCRIFGEPMEGDGYKTSAEWDIRFEDGTIATIYDYKTCPAYCGPDGVPPENNTSWHIGGFHTRAVDLIRLTLERSQ